MARKSTVAPLYNPVALSQQWLNEAKTLDPNDDRLHDFSGQRSQVEQIRPMRVRTVTDTVICPRVDHPLHARNQFDRQ